ncbi:MAG: RnfABCDGE type electron transport complex subunit D [Bacteroidales bacterium]
MAAIALLLGMAYLLYRENLSPGIPVSILGTVFVFSGILWLANPDRFADPCSIC